MEPIRDLARSEPRPDAIRDMGPRFEARAVNVAERIEVRGIEPRISSHLPVTVPPSLAVVAG